MVWVDAGSSPKIETAWMDGTHRLPLVTEALGLPTGLTIDSVMKHRIFWADHKLGIIESINWDGSDRVKILKNRKQDKILLLFFVTSNVTLS